MACNANATELFSECHNMNASKVYVLATIRGSVSIACFGLCLFTFVLEIIYFCSKRSVSTTLSRMFVYLTLSSVLYTGVLSFHLGYKIAEKHCYFCIIVGFFDEYTGLVQLCLTFGVVVKLFHKLITTNCLKQRSKGFSHQHGAKIEGTFVVLSFVLPLLISWVPFVVKNGPYGPYGPWCWIRRIENNCNSSASGLLEELFIWYNLFAFVSFLSLLCIIVIVIYLIYIYNKFRGQLIMRSKLRRVIADYCLLLPFLIIFTIVCLIEISVVIFNSKIFNTFEAWCLYAIATPIGGVAIPIGFLIFFIRKQKDTFTQTEITAISHNNTAPESTRFSPNSFTDQQDRPNFLSRSDEWSAEHYDQSKTYTVTETLRNFFSSSNKHYGTMKT